MAGDVTDNGRSERHYDENSTAAEVIAGHDLHGRDVVVTGGTSGLGCHTAQAFAMAGARVILAGRNPIAGERAAAAVARDAGNRQVAFELLDLASLTSVESFADRYLATGRPLHILVNNAGVMATPYRQTANGFELQFGTNHVGHFALTKGLLPALTAAGGARVVSVSSSAHRRSDIDFDDPNFERREYDPWVAYGQSKTANGLFAVELTRRFAGQGIFANAATPGAAMTGLQRHLSTSDKIARGWLNPDGSTAEIPGWKTPEQGAATFVWAAVAPELEGVGGLYLNDCAIAEPWTGHGNPSGFGYYRPYLLDPERAGRLWTLTEQLIEDRAAAGRRR
ncbi:MAG: SDR family NAD(P)-dependent oxidoreductase [Streptosporangiaceae bacterium]|nr:SDR family NAD(P)-dependent oxidoreductase [Streptosporangiaceae bacterium]